MDGIRKQVSRRVYAVDPVPGLALKPEHHLPISRTRHFHRSRWHGIGSKPDDNEHSTQSGTTIHTARPRPSGPAIERERVQHQETPLDRHQTQPTEFQPTRHAWGFSIPILWPDGDGSQVEVR